MVKVLVIEDEKLSREKLKKLIASEGYEAFSAEDGKSGLEVYSLEKPDIIIVDVRMPDISGLEVLARIKNESKMTEVIIMTGHGGTETAVKALREGAFDYITKPIDFDELEISIKKAAEKQEMQRRLDEFVAKQGQELKNTQAQLVQSEKMAAIGQFSAGLAHEIRNPLTAITMNTSFLLEELKDNEKAVKKLKIIEKEADRSAGIIKSLLSFSRQKKEDRSLIDINSVINDALTPFAHQIALSNIDIIKELDRQLPKINANANELSQVFLNLVTNAVDAMGGPGKLFIKSYYDKATENTAVFKPGQSVVCVKFTDTGKGIPKEALGSLFNPFYTTKDPGKGTGLGLFISHGIIKGHGGEIEVESEIGKGTSFTIKLPVAE
ncbi:MAG: response regulator [Elusimicrobia bacterium]|nr:response regulator [Candidatus Liberimonas magnetica]